MLFYRKKFLDYGKMAATFLNLKTNKAVRIFAREDSRAKAKEHFPDIENNLDVAGTRAIPLVVKKSIVEEAVRIAEAARNFPLTPALSPWGEGEKKFPLPSGERIEVRGGLIEVKEMRRPKAGVVVTGNEVYHGKIKDAFAPVITKKIEEIGGELVGVYYAPDDKAFIVDRLRELLKAGADLLITTGGMSVDPDDVTRFAIRELGAGETTYGSAVLPGAMFLVGYIGVVPILGIPACGMYAKTTIFDLVLPRVLAGEKIGRRELAKLGHGGLCMKCDVCRYPVCPFGKLG